MTEAIGELACSHRSTASVKGHEDVPAMLVRQRPEDGLELVELP
jgi:hypothetical protein